MPHKQDDCYLDYGLIYLGPSEVRVYIKLWYHQSGICDYPTLRNSLCVRCREW